MNINFRLWCNNESVLKTIDPKVKKSTFIALCKPEGPLVHQTRELLQKLKKVSLDHVKGHQDDSVPYEWLPLPAQLNVDCNTRAKSKMQETGVMSGRATPFEGTEVGFYIEDDLVITNLDKRIQLALYDNDIIKYPQSKYKWTQNKTDSINFKAVGLANARLSHAASIHVFKMMHKWLKIEHQREQINGSVADVLCPCCGLKQEDQSHMF